MKVRAILEAVAFFLILMAVWALTKSVRAEEIDVKKLMKEVDELYRANSSYAELEMEIITPHWQRTLAMKAWSIGMDKTFIRITAPKKENGVGTLRIENEMWNYLPKTNKVIKIPPSMMMSSWMGSDFTNDDLVKEFSLFEDFTYELVTVEDAEEGLIYINSIPREDLPIVWGNILIAVREKDHVPVWEKYFDEKGTLMRVLKFSDVRQFRERRIPAVMEMIPQNKEGHKTVIRYNLLEYDIAVDEDVFSLRHLRSQE
ncbi:MAG: outer membrane lipoprotein-sorting protein [candidate division Zixibacteria bacterium]|nr:outer membrane lipoprotein-sorting protein [candidate division Zixibacteria bacterium]